MSECISIGFLTNQLRILSHKINDPKLMFIIDICVDQIERLYVENDNLKEQLEKVIEENEMLQAVVDGIQSREVKKL